MLEIISITFVSSIISIAYQIMIRPGELLQGWARFVNFTFSGTPIQKLLLCPYCFGGQIAFWSSLAYVINGYSFSCFVSVPCTIVTVYFIIKNHNDIE